MSRSGFPFGWAMRAPKIPFDVSIARPPFLAAGRGSPTPPRFAGRGSPTPPVGRRNTHHQLADALGLSRLETEGVLKRRKVSSGVTAEEMCARAAALRDVSPE